MINNLPQLLDVDIQLSCKPDDVFSFANNVKLHCFEDKDSEIIRLEFIFLNAGSVNQDKFFTSAASANLITEGCGELSAIEVADKLDFYAAYVERVSERDSTSLVFYFLKKYQQNLLPLIEKIIKQANYNEKEFEIYISKQKQNFEINAQKTSMIAYKEFYRTIFSENHPLSKFGEKEDFDKLSPSDVKSFYEDFYTSSQSEIILSGNYDKAFVRELERFFGTETWGGEKENFELKDYSIDTNCLNKGLEKTINKKGAAQASVRVGCVSLEHNHKDFLPFSVVVCLLGGYFGSRLMMNIREDKGYTYGISANLSSYRYASVFSIASDVKADKAQATIDEIEKEITILQNDLVSLSELSQVKNYLIGECIRNLDGAFDKSDKYSFLMKLNHKYDYYKNFIDTVKSISPNEIRDLSQKYLDLNLISKIKVGDTEILI
ncbi:MAG: insulinase family protein [Bacteroidales bacterium]|nr:insulinase family protein [Bacteroidales bacterium]